MSNLARVREASVTVARIQRRIWLIETVAPVVAVGGVVIAIAVGGWLWRRRSTPTVTRDVTTGEPARAPQPGLNGVRSGNHSS